MRYLVSRPLFTHDIIEGVERARRKEAHAEIIRKDDEILIIVRAGFRPVGKFVFKVIDTDCVIHRYFISEKTYCPFSLALSELTKFLKRKKIKYIDTKESAII